MKWKTFGIKSLKPLKQTFQFTIYINIVLINSENEGRNIGKTGEGENRSTS